MHLVGARVQAEQGDGQGQKPTAESGQGEQRLAAFGIEAQGGDVNARNGQLQLEQFAAGFVQQLALAGQVLHIRFVERLLRRRGRSTLNGRFVHIFSHTSYFPQDTIYRRFCHAAGAESARSKACPNARRHPCRPDEADK